MGVLKKSTPRKSETKVVPDEKDGTLPYVKSHIGSQVSEVIFAEAETYSEAEITAQTGQLSVDVFQTADEIVIVAPVAGVKLDDLHISITDEVLTIKGRRSFQFQVSESDYFTQECFWGNFSRSVILPDAVDVSRVAASFKDGILTVRIPKVEKIKTRMIAIKEE